MKLRGCHFQNRRERPVCRSWSLWNTSCVVVPHSELVSPLIRQGFALPASLLWYSCHWQLCFIGFAARRTAPGEGFCAKKTASRKRSGFLMLALPIFPASHPASIVGADELNFCVRDGNRWTLVAINTNFFLHIP